MPIDKAENSGAYRLYIRLARSINITAGRLGSFTLAAGTYVYTGSAKRGLSQRVERHRRLAKTKQGRCHWHIDQLLLHPDSRLQRAEMIPGGNECNLSLQLAARRDVSIPIRGFGATDCTAGCPAHLYRLDRA